MKDNLLSTYAKLAAILSFALYAIDFLNLNPFKSNDDHFEKSVIEETVKPVNDDHSEKSVIEETVKPVNDDHSEKSVIEETVKPVNEPTTSNIDNKFEDDIIDWSKAKSMSFGEILLIPFKDHLSYDYLWLALRKYFHVSNICYEIILLVLCLPCMYSLYSFIMILFLFMKYKITFRRGRLIGFERIQKQYNKYMGPASIGFYYSWYLFTLIGSINWF